MYTVYAISSTTRSYIYVGMTSDLPVRLQRHNSGLERTTRPYRPFLLLYLEEVADRRTARIREKYWKSGTGKEQLKQMKK